MLTRKRSGGTPLVPCSTGAVPVSLRRNGSGKPAAAALSNAGPATSTQTLYSPSTNGLLVPANGGGATSPGVSPGGNNIQEFSVKAKQEVYVMQRVSELQREGLWTERRLPKLQEPSRPKAHWDYLLEEMVWLAADFAQERKWKKNAAKKCARMVQKYFQDKANAAQKAEKAQEAHLRRVSSFMAKEVKIFWSNVEKLVEYKHHTKLEEKRKKALDQHLSFIVDQTEKFSQQLAEGMSRGIADATGNSAATSANVSRMPSPKQNNLSDDDFRPETGSEDDEETIAKAEEEATDVKEEVAALEKESQMELDDFLKDLPPGYLENRDKIILDEEDSKDNEDDPMDGHAGGSSRKASTRKSRSKARLLADEDDGDGDGDAEFEANESSDDDENTISMQEEEERDVDHRKELDDLEADNDLTVEELLAKYHSGRIDDAPTTSSSAMRHSEASVSSRTRNRNKPALDSDDEEMGEDARAEEAMQVSEDSTDEDANEDDGDDDDDDDDDEEEEECDASSEDGASSANEGVENDDDEEEEDGLKSLVQDENRANKDEMIKDAAALAESIQPKGNTLSSTNVVTPVPFLLKHTLREYQHIGLDWLVTMYERKLNGILADEMGLGKTIQTIALLAHLACVKENWGPHLIVVPSSVMLNWEMEFKKWCPGFKILTYYGSQKERKMKRVGWTKPNAFHVCITSYKLVIQDQQSFRRKKWKYLILDEAQNIKNFKSQRWQLLLNFSTERRLLLTGTPLQNDLMELWSLMHFLMPYVFSSHREFKEWFSNPMTGMIEGNTEYNEALISRLHKVIRPFLLRRLKKEVEKQMPKKYEHVVMCRLSNRQRYLYDDFMSRAKTKETLQTGNLLSVINVLMQLRKVCNHPNMFEVRPTISPFQMDGIVYQAARLICDLMDYDPFTQIDLHTLNLVLIQLELTLTAYASHRCSRLGAPRKLIEEIDSMPELPPRCPTGKFKFHIRVRDPEVQQNLSRHHASGVRVGASPAMKTEGNKLVPISSRATTIVKAAATAQSSLAKRLTHINPVNVSRLKLLECFDDKSIITKRSVVSVAPSSAPHASTLRGTVRLTIHGGTPQYSAGLTAGAQVTPRANPVGSHFNRVTLSSSGGRLTLQKTALSASASPATSVFASSTARATDQRKSDNPLLINTLAKHVKSANEANLKMQIDCDNKKNDPNNDDTSSGSDPVYSMTNILKLRKEQRLARLKLMAEVNKRRLDAIPIYGEDCREAMQKFGSIPNRMLKYSTWHSRSYINCRTASARKDVWSLTKILKSYEQRCEELREIFANFCFYVPSACAPRIRFYVHNLASGTVKRQLAYDACIKREVAPKLALLHPIISAMTTQFPDPRLIQYDCGKLQTLNTLLRKLKAEQHRVLIFTQMTKMLDVLEAFLNYHGHIYLRLDGSTRIEQRQILMERFNGDKRIFCFILSTRSGGVGINLTGADTVIFYDSDWNPTMDAQAQDRCHRIGQTRDVHIYRLVSEKTIEVNILKKANQKRMLSDMAIEGGNFTASYFKSSTIKDLFNMEQSEQEASSTTPPTLQAQEPTSAVISDRVHQQLLSSSDMTGSTAATGEVEVEKHALRAFENALAEAEDDQDVQAAKTAKAEAAADLAEFDETIPIEEATVDPVSGNQEMSKADLEMQNLVKQLSPIERYAMRFVEETGAAWTAEQLRAVEAEIEAQKREWEANRLAAIRKEEELLKQDGDADVMLTYNRKDALNQVNKNKSKQLNCLKARNARLLKRSRLGTGSKRLRNRTRQSTTANSLSKEEPVSSSIRSNRPNARRRYAVEAERGLDESSKAAARTEEGDDASDDDAANDNDSMSEAAHSESAVAVSKSRVTRSGNSNKVRDTKSSASPGKRGTLRGESDAVSRRVAAAVNGKEGGGRRKRSFADSPSQNSNRKTTRSSTAAATEATTAAPATAGVTSASDNENSIGNFEVTAAPVAARPQNRTGVKNQKLLKIAAKRRAMREKSRDPAVPMKRAKMQSCPKSVRQAIDESDNSASDEDGEERQEGEGEEEEEESDDIAPATKDVSKFRLHNFASDLEEVPITDNDDDEGNFYGIPSDDETTQLVRHRQQHDFLNMSFETTSDDGGDDATANLNEASETLNDTNANADNGLEDNTNDANDNDDDEDEDDGDGEDDDNTRSSYATAGDDNNEDLDDNYDDDKEIWDADAQMQDTNATNSTYYNVSEETESDELESITPASRMLGSSGGRSGRRSGTPSSVGNSKKFASVRRLDGSVSSLGIANPDTIDKNSPRTRSRGSVKINLWTLDESQVLPDIIKKPRNRTLSEMGIGQRGKAPKATTEPDCESNEAKSFDLANEANNSDADTKAEQDLCERSSYEMTGHPATPLKLKISRRKSLKRESLAEESAEANKAQVTALQRWLLKGSVKAATKTRKRRKTSNGDQQNEELEQGQGHQHEVAMEAQENALDASNDSDTDFNPNARLRHHNIAHSMNGLTSKAGQEEAVS